MTTTRQAPARGDRGALAKVLNALEADLPEPERIAWLDALWPFATAVTLGITGPPGVGKSTLIGRLIAAWRAAQRTVAVLCVDPSSRQSGGALLGDRVRLGVGGDDPGVFVRSLAARGMLGGLAPAAFDMALALAATHDRVIVETVGVGQSEIAIADVADLVAVVLQPGSGDALQYIKAGIMEIPDLIAVNKADLGALATETAREARQAVAARGRRDVPILPVSASAGDGVATLVDTLDRLIAERAPTLGGTRDVALSAELLARFERWFGAHAVREAGGREGLYRRVLGVPAATLPSARWALLGGGSMDACG